MIRPLGSGVGHFGALDIPPGPGGQLLRRAGEAFDVLFRHRRWCLNCRLKDVPPTVPAEQSSNVDAWVERGQKPASDGQEHDLLVELAIRALGVILQGLT